MHKRILQLATAACHPAVSLDRFVISGEIDCSQFRPSKYLIVNDVNVL